MDGFRPIPDSPFIQTFTHKGIRHLLVSSLLTLHMKIKEPRTMISRSANSGQVKSTSPIRPRSTSIDCTRPKKRRKKQRNRSLISCQEQENGTGKSRTSKRTVPIFGVMPTSLCLTIRHLEGLLSLSIPTSPNANRRKRKYGKNGTLPKVLSIPPRLSF